MSDAIGIAFDASTIELIESTSGPARNEVLATGDSLLCLLRGRGVRLTFGSADDAAKLALAVLAIAERLKLIEGAADRALGDLLAKTEFSGHA